MHKCQNRSRYLLVNTYIVFIFICLKTLGTVSLGVFLKKTFSIAMFLFKVYRKIKEFETRLTEGLGVCLKTTNSTAGQSSNGGGSNGDRLRYHPHHHSHMTASNGRNSLQPPPGGQVSARTRHLSSSLGKYY